MLNQNLQNTIYVLQKRLIRGICNAPPRQHSMPMYKDLGIITVRDQLILHNCKLIDRVIHGTCQ